MKAKLIKTEVNYILLDDKDVVIASTSLKKEGLALSLKNCQAIECGYELDELAYEKSWNEDSEKGFINGAKAILEIMADKKFSEEDLLKAFIVGVFTESEKSNYTKEYEELLKSLQQTEWDVEILEVPYYNGDFVNDGKTHPIEIEFTFDLDKDGCLILKPLSKDV